MVAAAHLTSGGAGGGGAEEEVVGRLAGAFTSQLKEALKEGMEFYCVTHMYMYSMSHSHACHTCNAEVEYSCLSGVRRHLPCINFKRFGPPS